MKFFLILIFFCVNLGASSSESDLSDLVSGSNSSGSKNSKKQSSSSTSSETKKTIVVEIKKLKNANSSSSEELRSEKEIQTSLASLILQVIEHLKLENANNDTLKAWNATVDGDMKKFFLANDASFTHSCFHMEESVDFANYKKKVLIQPRNDINFINIRKTLITKDATFNFNNYIDEKSKDVAGSFYQKIIEDYEVFKKLSNDKNNTVNPKSNEIPRGDNKNKGPDIVVDNPKPSNNFFYCIFGGGIMLVASFLGYYFYQKKTKNQIFLIPSIPTDRVIFDFSSRPEKNFKEDNQHNKEDKFDNKQENLSKDNENETNKIPFIMENKKDKPSIDEIFTEKINLPEIPSSYVKTSSVAKAMADKQKNIQTIQNVNPTIIPLILLILSSLYLSKDLYESRKISRPIKETSWQKTILRGIVIGIAVVCAGMLIGNHLK